MSSKTNRTKLYAKALAEVILASEKARGGRASTDSIVKNFVQFLEKNGQMHGAKEILNLAEDFLLVKQGKRKITFETARRLTADHRAKLKEFVEEGDIVKEKVNHELIAGVKITINNEKQFDNSMLNKINNLLCLKK